MRTNHFLNYVCLQLHALLALYQGFATHLNHQKHTDNRETVGIDIFIELFSHVHLHCYLSKI